MEELDRKEIERILSLKTATAHDKNQMLYLVKKYIDGNANYCLQCPGAVSALFNRLKKWYHKL